VTTVDAAVITVPAYFNDDQRQATKDAGRSPASEVKRHHQRADRRVARVWPRQGDPTRRSSSSTSAAARSTCRARDRRRRLRGQVDPPCDNHSAATTWDKAVVDWLAGEFKKDQAIDLKTDRWLCSVCSRPPRRRRSKSRPRRSRRSTCRSSLRTPQARRHLDVRHAAKFQRAHRRPHDRVVAPVRQALDDAKSKGVDGVDRSCSSAV